MLFINGLPFFTLELKNSLTKQTVDDAVWQYKKERNPREKLFEFGRCVAQFAVGENEVRFCTHLKGKASWFHPFNRSWNDGAGNSPNPGGLKTDDLWREVLTRQSLTDILENYAQVVVTRDEKTGDKKQTQIWPCSHQLDVVRRLPADVNTHGAGRRYLIQHSAGSGNTYKLYEVLSRRYAMRDASKPWVFRHRYKDRKTGNEVTGLYKDRKSLLRGLCGKAGVKYFR